MPRAARVTDTTTHGGTIIGPGDPTVLISGMPASVMGDKHVCVIPPPAHVPSVGPFPMGSATVLIGGKPAIRVGDVSICSASAAIGEPTVMLG